MNNLLKLPVARGDPDPDTDPDPDPEPDPDAKSPWIPVALPLHAALGGPLMPDMRHRAQEAEEIF